MIFSKPGFFRRLFGGGSEANTERRATERARPSDGTRILIIDDSSTIIAVLGKMLRQGGFETLSAPDAEAGIETALRERPDLIFLDIVLPGMNGFAALRVLRREEATKDTPIIMMSGNLQATEQYYAQRIGADDFLKKPFPRAELFAKIQRLTSADKKLHRQPGGPGSPSAQVLSARGEN